MAFTREEAMEMIDKLFASGDKAQELRDIADANKMTNGALSLMFSRAACSLDEAFAFARAGAFMFRPAKSIAAEE